MKNASLLTIILLLLYCCSSSNNDNMDNPNLSFVIEDGNRFASSQINVNNTTTNFSGNFTWEVNTLFGTETYTTENLSFTADRATEYTIKLRTNDNVFSVSEVLVITRPTKIKLKRMTLVDIEQDYDALYFLIYSMNGAAGSAYVSPPRQNVSALNPSATFWNMNGPNSVVAVSDGSNPDEILAHIIEMRDGDNNDLLSRLDSFDNFYDESRPFIAGEFEYETAPISCGPCQYFKVKLEIEFLE